MRLRFALPILTLSLFAFAPIAAPVNVTGSSAFVGGLNGAWSFEYVSGAPDLYLQEITIDLSPTILRFDTAPGGFGSLSHLDVGDFNGTDAATGLTSISSTGFALDGGALITFQFSNFLPGSTFEFRADVDEPNPTLLALQNCSGRTGLSLAICLATNAGRTATNAALLLDAQTVGPNQMAGALITYQFGGAGYQTFSVTGAYQPVSLQDIVRGILSGEGTRAFATESDLSTPEPASMITLGAGLLLIAGWSRRRSLRR